MIEEEKYFVIYNDLLLLVITSYATSIYLLQVNNGNLRVRYERQECENNVKSVYS